MSLEKCESLHRAIRINHWWSGPQDVHPTAYASTVVPPPGLTGPPLLLQLTSTHPPIFRPQSSGPPSGDNLHLPPPAPAPASRSSPVKQLEYGHTLSDYNIQTTLVSPLANGVAHLLVMQLMLTPMTSKPRYRVTVSWSPSLVKNFNALIMIVPFKWDGIGGLKD
ncbi:hypothetical protein DFJ58DRAFT_841703 [Suillus subalutaceus]|uniref:uncharacterized protein n=1 Tax=Suillus subalutaceus TaxID=48586 RepID=UPI001B8774B2|nr:uncharacterized protein DFJ58DRAFT_841703 [Suillus subalutaceus]KAG1853176.1 hypothetical protein DFJ58DRAFT_841703 [Suillus subalutaceus]